MCRIFDFIAFTFICPPQIFVMCANLKCLRVTFVEGRYNFNLKKPKLRTFKLKSIYLSINYFREKPCRPNFEK